MHMTWRHAHAARLCAKVGGVLLAGQCGLPRVVVPCLDTETDNPVFQCCCTSHNYMY